MRKIALCMVVAAALGSASGAPVQTGTSVQLSRDGRQVAAHVYWANLNESDATVYAFPGVTRVGDRYDLVDQKGWLGRVAVVDVEENACGDVKYQQARARFIGGKPGRESTNVLVALGPSARVPARARVLVGQEVHAPPPPGWQNLQAVDLDGDGSADLARYVLANCHTSRTRGPDGDTCIETWAREGGTWQLLEKAEFPPCY